jgi:GTP-binding protein YchF
MVLHFFFTWVRLIYMLVRCGIVGLPNVGKSTLFNAITETSNAAAENYPFCTIEPNIAIVPIIDERLNQLRDIAKSLKIIYVALECRDIAGLVKGASQGKGRGNDFLKHIREVDLIIHLVRGFGDDDIMHVEGSVDPIRDVEIINLELAYSDLQQLEKIKQKSNIIIEAIDLLKKDVHLSDLANNELLSDYRLISLKPMIYALNVSEKQIHDSANSISDLEPIVLAVKIEDELSKTPQDERNDFMDIYSMQESGLNKIMKAAYKKLGMITYFTVGPQEARGWTISNGFTAQQAAGVIHTDIARGFIAAEVVSWAEFVEHGGWSGCKSKGILRIEGREYKMRDGDVCLFRHNT